jgi:hypothetical protein
MELKKVFNEYISLYDELRDYNKESSFTYQSNVYDKIYYEIKEIYNNYNSKQRKQDYIINKINKDKLSEIDLLNSRYVSQKVRRYIYDNITHIVTYTFKINKNKFNNVERNITTYFSVFNNDINIETLDNYVLKIKILLSFLYRYSSVSCSKNLELYLFLSNKKKQLPEKQLPEKQLPKKQLPKKTSSKILDEDNINSAVTTSCSVNGQLLIYRKEEWYKVLIHELFHILGLDFSSINIDKYSFIVRKYFNDIKTDCLLFEAYCELWAIILNSCFNVFFKEVKTKVNREKTKIYKSTFIKKLKENLELERKYSIFQMNKIIKYMDNNLHYSDFINDNYYSRMKVSRYYRENTNVFCYYFIKTILLNNLEGFIKWCYNNNSNILNFNKDTDKIESFIKLIIKNSSKEFLINEIEIFNILYNYSKERNYQKRENKELEYLMSNLRMSIV